MKFVILSTILIFLASAASAQLPSEKTEPVQMNRYKKELSGKQGGSKVLPSEKSSPAAIESNKKKQTSPQGGTKLLPSSANFNRRMYTAPRKP